METFALYMNALKPVNLFVTYPLDSTCLGICQVSELQGQLRVTNIDDVKQKLVILPLRNDFIVMPLLHCNEAKQL